MSRARRATVSLTYNDKDAGQMSEYLSSFCYTDVASGSSDSISIELSDRDRRWINGWFPQKGDRLRPTIKLHDWNAEGKDASLKCGSFVIDDFSFQGDPIRCSIEAVAIPSTSGFKATERTQTYEKTSLKEIGQKIAKRNNLGLFFDAADISIEKVAQDKQPDSTFYNDLLVQFGLALKVYSDRLVVFSEAACEKKQAIITLSESDFEPGWQWNTTLAGTYTGVKYQYTHTEKNQTFTASFGGGDRILTCDDAANNQTEATIIALAKVNNANKNTTTMKITLREPAENIVATQCVMIKGLGKLSGKYFVEQAVHTVGDGAKLSLSLRKVETRITQNTKAKIASTTAEEKRASTTFRKGDKVRIRKGTKSYTGGKLPSRAYTTVFTVSQVGGKGYSNDRVSVNSSAEVFTVKAEDLFHA